MGSENRREDTENARPVASGIARHLLTGERVLMGLMLVGFGLHGLVDSIPASLVHDGAAAFGSTLMKAGCMFPLLKGTEVLLEVYVGAGARKA